MDLDDLDRALLLALLERPRAGLREHARALRDYWIARAAFEQVLGGRMVELPHAELPTLERGSASAREEETP